MYAELEEIINLLLAKIGSRLLINKLRNFYENVDFSESKQFLFIQATLLDYFHINENELYEGQKPAMVNARRLLIYFLSVNTKIGVDEICKICKITTKTYRRYREYVGNVMLNANVDKELDKALQQLNEIYYKHYK